MTDREKLIELIAGTRYGKENASIVGDNFQCGFIEKIADHLIANGAVIKKHGRWIMRGGKLYCSACQQRACVARDSEDFWYTKGTDCCPNCGAKMDGGEKE